MIHANEAAAPAAETKRDWWNDPFGVFKPQANPTALKVHGFVVGIFFGIIGVVAVALLSSAEKRAHRVIGAGAGLAVWLPLCVALSA